MDGHVRCKVGIAVWGRMYGNRELGGEPGSLLLYIIVTCRQMIWHGRGWQAKGCGSTALPSNLWAFDGSQDI